MADPTCEQICDRIRGEGIAPLASAGFARRVRGRWIEATGGAVDVPFDLASVTKPVVAVAFATSGLARTKLLAELVPEAEGTHAGALPIELAFAHRAGLEAHGKLWLPLVAEPPGSIDRPRSLETAARSTRADLELASPLGAPYPPLYSDLGYILAGEALGRAHAARTDDVVDAVITKRLGLDGTLGSARVLEAHGLPLREIAAPTELVPWRDDGAALRGRVHDENAWALAPDGVQGHAGLFGTIAAVLRFGEATLDAILGHRSPLGVADSLEWLVRERPGGTLRAGFDGKSGESSSAGTVLGPRTFGHLGFTGTSVWIDPDAELVVALLTNRVCPTRDNVKIRAARPWAHDELARAALRR